ncbi:MAG: alpha/beta hydrolase fold domain-containing protein, partial [Pseudomonadota bacterium]
MAKLDGDTKTVLRDLNANQPLTKGDPDIGVVRRAYDEIFAAWTAPPARKTNEIWVSDCGLGESRQALAIEPSESEAGSGAIIFIHGGGWSLGNALCYAPLGRWICAETRRRVIVPDFPQAPESSAPAAYDALSGLLTWAASRYGQEISLMGDSAGGNLAAVLSNHPPSGLRIQKQALLYPVMDLRPDAKYPSRKKYGQGRHFLTADGIVGAAIQYCSETGDPNSPLISPVLETDFGATPPTIILIPELDPLRDECLASANAQHGFFSTLNPTIERGASMNC